MAPGIKITLGPAVVGALAQQQQLFCRQRRLLLERKMRRPVRVQLVAAVPGHVHEMRRSILGDPFGVANAGREPLRGREVLVRACRVIAPDAATRRGLRTGLRSRRFECPLLPRQELLALATSTYIWPSAAIRNGCIG